MTLRAFLRGFEKDVQADIAEGELDNADIQHIRDIFDQWVEESRRELVTDIPEALQQIDADLRVV